MHKQIFSIESMGIQVLVHFLILHVKYSGYQNDQIAQC